MWQDEIGYAMRLPSSSNFMSRLRQTYQLIAYRKIKAYSLVHTKSVYLDTLTCLATRFPSQDLCCTLHVYHTNVNEPVNESSAVHLWAQASVSLHLKKWKGFVICRSDRSERPAREVKPGDWKCGACNAHNFSRNSECFRCSAPA